MDYKKLRPEVQNYMKSIQSTLEEENYLKNVDSASLDLLATNLNIIFDAKEILDKDGIVRETLHLFSNKRHYTIIVQKDEYIGGGMTNRYQYVFEKHHRGCDLSAIVIMLF